jgi:hypothetical protein
MYVLLSMKVGTESNRQLIKFHFRNNYPVKHVVTRYMRGYSLAVS